jgi:hypothetical protein
MSRTVDQLELLRQRRGRSGRDVSIAKLIAATADQAARTHKNLGALIELWEQIVPADVAAHTALIGLRAGVLHVRVDSSSMAYDLDRLLRGGLTDTLRRGFRGTLVRVKTRVA